MGGFVASQGGASGIFTELYQLLFHLFARDACDRRRGLTAPHAAVAMVPKSASSAAITAAVLIPVLNIFLLAITGIVATTAALYKIPPHWQTIAALAVVCAA